MKTWMSIAMVAAGFALGCTQQPNANQKQTATVSPVLDVQPVTASAPAPVYAPPASPAAPSAAPAEAVAAKSAPATTQTPATTPPPAAPVATAANYTVKKGDTLYRIAKEKYGDGKQWQKIASANPGVTPSSLRVGQTLVVP